MSLPAEKPTPAPADELPFWRRKAMKDMTAAEWESLCDGCGRCCLNKLQEEGTDRTYYTDVGCKLLDGQTCRCTDYAEPLRQGEGLRHAHVAQHQPHLMAAADLRLQARGGGEGFVLVASAGVRRPGDGAPGRACRCAARSARARSTCRTRILEDHIVSWPLKWPKGAKGSWQTVREEQGRQVRTGQQRQSLRKYLTT